MCEIFYTKATIYVKRASNARYLESYKQFHVTRNIDSDLGFTRNDAGLQ